LILISFPTDLKWLARGMVEIYSVARLKPMRRLGGSGGGCSMGSSFR
jgi:hypothetical protein